MTNPEITAQDVNKLHRAGIGQYRPMGDSVIARCDELVELGLLGRNTQTGYYYLTETGARALSSAR